MQTTENSGRFATLKGVKPTVRRVQPSADDTPPHPPYSESFQEKSKPETNPPKKNPNTQLVIYNSYTAFYHPAYKIFLLKLL